MIDIDKAYTALQNALHRYKNRPLAFESGCMCGRVSRIEKSGDRIYVYGFCGWSPEDQCLMIITERMSKGKDYKYWREYHILESFR